jgi:hypothetical protein
VAFFAGQLAQVEAERQEDRAILARAESWSEAFAPRSDLPAADSVPVFARGSIGRRVIELDPRAEALARMKARAWEAPAGYRFDRDEANER